MRAHADRFDARDMHVRQYYWTPQLSNGPCIAARGVLRRNTLFLYSGTVSARVIVRFVGNYYITLFNGTP